MFIFYPAIFALGICASYSDIKYKKIKNAHLAFFASLGLIAYLFLAYNNEIALNYKFFLNIFVAFFIGFLLYLSDIWAAGDAKLFSVFCLLMPTKKYSEIFPFPCIPIFINIFLLSTIIIFILSIAEIIKTRAKILKIIFLKKIIRMISETFFIIFSLGWIISFVTRPAEIYLSPILKVIIFYFIYRLIYKATSKIKKQYIYIPILISGIILRIILQPQDFKFAIILSHIRITAFYTLLFSVLQAIFGATRNKDPKENTVIFAPLMFAGTLAVNTNLIYWVMHIFNILRK